MDFQNRVLLFTNKQLLAHCSLLPASCSLFPDLLNFVCIFKQSDKI